MAKLRDVTPGQDIIDIRDVIARFKDLESERDTALAAIEDENTRTTELEAKERTEDEDEELADLRRCKRWESDKGIVFPEDWDEDQENEFRELETLLEDCQGSGGDEQFRGNWYPVTLILESYFETYAQDLAEDCGMVNRDASWPNNYIDWERASEALKHDYTTVEYGGFTYYTR